MKQFTVRNIKSLSPPPEIIKKIILDIWMAQNSRPQFFKSFWMWFRQESGIYILRLFIHIFFWWKLRFSLIEPKFESTTISIQITYLKKIERRIKTWTNLYTLIILAKLGIVFDTPLSKAHHICLCWHIEITWFSSSHFWGYTRF